MAEKSPQSGGGEHQGVAQNRRSDKIEIHRVNDVLFGHVGQISYHSPRDVDADIGELGFSRVIENPPSFEQVLPSEQWFSSTRTKLDAPQHSNFQDIKSQKYWLLKTHPEAFLGNVGLQATISEHTRPSRFLENDAESQQGSILAVGEISDLRNPSRPAARPALAMTAGEARHMLRVSMVNLDKWTWAESSFPIGRPQSQFYGTWSSEGVSISKIEFATKRKQLDSIRWLIVQRSTSTTIIRPEIRAKPVTTMVQTAMLEDSDLELIALDPIVTLTKNTTGGHEHSDFAVNVGSETDSVQIAIVDKRGNWWVWFIDSQDNHHGGPPLYTAILKSRGSCGPSSSKGHAHQLCLSETLYRISWVCRSAAVDDWEHDSNPSEILGKVTRSLQADYLAGHANSGPKYDGLLICDGTRLQVLDTEGFKVRSYLDFSRRHGADVLLEAQSVEGSPSHVLVLTTEKLYVLDISTVGDQQSGRPRTLISCPHFRSKTRQALKMYAVGLQSSAEYVGSLVLVYSRWSSRVQLFHVTINAQNASASFHHQVVQLPGFHNHLDELAGIASLHAVRLRRSASKGHNRSRVSASYVEDNEPRLFELFVLGNDLGLTSVVVGIAFGSARWPGSPEMLAKTTWKGTKWRDKLRKKEIRDVENALVVPDEAEEVRHLSCQRLTTRIPKSNSIQLRSYLIMLLTEINAGFFGKCSFESGGDKRVEPFGSIEEMLEKRETHEYVSLQPLLGFKDPWHALDLAELDVTWNLHLGWLKRSTDAQFFQCGTLGLALGVTDLFERFSIDWSSGLEAESLKGAQWRRMQLALERMAADVFLSEKGIYVAPQSTLDLGFRAKPREANSQSSVDDLYGDVALSRAESETTLPTPSATPSSSRATSQVADFSEMQEYEDAFGQEHAAVTRLRMHLPSIRFTPPTKQGQSRLMSLWPEQRGHDPQTYKYSRKGKGAEGLEQAAKRRQEKEAERRRRRAERRAQLGIKLEGSGDFTSQVHVADEVRWSPPPRILAAKSQGQYQGFGLGSQSQALSQGQNSGPSQTMSQPIPGEFGTRSSVVGKKTKRRPKATPGLR